MSDTHYCWQQITNLPDNWKDFDNETLRHLAKVWMSQKSSLNDAARKSFVEKMQRQWAIETGLIENLYTLDRGITMTLIEQGLDAIDIPHSATNKLPSYVKRLIKDQQEVVEGLFDFVGGTRQLSTSYIKELHAQLTRSQAKTEAINSMGHHVEIELLKGDWKKLPNNPTRPDGKVHEYCPPEHVASEMDQLIKWHHAHTEQGVPPAIEAAWLHHRFTQIHPFQDGNGRVARALATLVFLKSGWFPLVVLNDDRKKYIVALESADNGDLQPLSAFFAQLAEKAFLKAISVSGGVLEAQSTRKGVLDAIRQSITSKANSFVSHENKAFSNADALIDTCLDVASELKQDLADVFAGANAGSHVPSLSINSSSSDTWHYYRGQLYTIGKQFDYFVNLEKYHRWVRLRIVDANARQCNIVVSIHAISKDFSGVMAATSFIEYRDRSDGTTMSHGLNAICGEPFIFTGEDDLQGLRSRFVDWVQAALTQGLASWQQNL